MTVTTYHGPSVTFGLDLTAQYPATAQVFLSYSVADLAMPLPSDAPGAASTLPVVRAVQQLLIEGGFTVWDCQQLHVPDIPEDVAVSRSIEACDNLVVFLSPRAISQTLCLQGLLFALSMNKRIIPVVLETIDPDQLPTQLQVLPVIDLRCAAAPLAQTPAGQQLVQTLVHEAAYHQAHTQLLMQALRWERQHRNPCLLMRGDCLKQYRQWLDAAQGHAQYPPIRVQALLIETSQTYRQPLGWQAHLIHTPATAAYAAQLSEVLQLFSQCTSFDHLNLLLGGQPRYQRRSTIEQAHSCVCIVSADALHNEAFLDDLDYALSLHKPLAVVSTAPMAAENLPSGLNYCPRFVMPEPTRELAGNFGKLFRLLEHNGQAAAYHTQLLQRALQWDRQHHDPKLLLQRHLLSEALAWLQRRPCPSPTALQQTYIQASQNSGAW
jgi:hypothetical protein